MLSRPSVPAPQTAAGYGPTAAGSCRGGFASGVVRYRVTSALVIVKDQTGKLHHAYRGELLYYLNDEQRAHFLRHKLVVEIDAGNDAPPQGDSLVVGSPRPINTTPAAPDVNADVASDCMRDLDRLGVDAASGSPRARKALRDAGLRYGNDVIAAAVRARKEGLSAVPDSADC